jgi:hypothetical protein
MALVINGITFEDGDEVYINGIKPKNILVNGQEVWRDYAGPPSPVDITTSGTYKAGIDFPAGIPLTICLVGGGGSGAMVARWSDCSDQSAGGGYAGEVKTSNVTLSHGETVEITIGSGGTGVTDDYESGLNGNSGTSTSFGTYVTASGGAGGTYRENTLDANFRGNGETVTTCFGNATNGIKEESCFESYIAYGGESSGYSNGGNGSVSSSVEGGDGGLGSGGGGVSVSKSASQPPKSGDGGNGLVRISW